MAMIAAAPSFEIIAVLAFLVLLRHCWAAEYSVGDTPGWNTGINYATWASGKNFTVGDTLKFVYGSTHTVLEVSQTDYNSCSSSNPINTQNVSPTTIQLSKAGAHYFICGTPGHCSQGMKLMVTASAASGTPSTPNTSPPNSPAGTPPNSTSTHSGGGALYVKGVVVALAFCLALVVLL